MYCINPITYENRPFNNQYINFQLNDFKIYERYDNLWVKGNILISSNSFLPNFSFYLDIDSEFAYNEQVYLNYVKTTDEYKDSKGKMIMKVDLYDFNFRINLKSSSFFNEWISYTNINFNIIPLFNQKVIRDFNINVKEDVLFNFINEINNSKILIQKKYWNYNEINPDIRKIILPINPLNNSEINHLTIKNHVLDNKPIIDCLSTISSNNTYINVKELELSMYYDFLNVKEPKKIELISKNFESETKELNVGFNSYYEYDKFSKTFKQKQNYINGIYSDSEVDVFFYYKIKLSINEMNRILVFKKYHRLKPTAKAIVSRLIDCKETTEKLERYWMYES